MRYLLDDLVRQCQGRIITLSAMSKRGLLSARMACHQTTSGDFSAQGYYCLEWLVLKWHQEISLPQSPACRMLHSPWIFITLLKLRKLESARIANSNFDWLKWTKLVVSEFWVFRTLRIFAIFGVGFKKRNTQVQVCFPKTSFVAVKCSFWIVGRADIASVSKQGDSQRRFESCRMRMS